MVARREYFGIYCNFRFNHASGVVKVYGALERHSGVHRSRLKQKQWYPEALRVTVIPAEAGIQEILMS